MFVERIAKPGIDTISEAVAILWLILRDYRRGWTYDHSSKYCRKIPMDERLFMKRARYVKTLAAKHGASKSELRRINEIINYVIKYRRLPREYLQRAKRIIVRIKR